MKRFRQFAGIILFLSLSFNFLQAQDVDIISKEKMEKVKFMDHLSVSIEAGTTGFGFEVATTLHPNFMLRAGFVIFPFLEKSGDAYINFYGGGNNLFNDIVRQIPQIKTALEDRKLPTSSQEIAEKIPMTDKFKLYNGKILIDYYPFLKDRFHITTGIYFGSRNIITSKGQLPSEYVAAIHVINQYLPGNTQFMPAVWRGDFLINDCLVEASQSGKVKYSRQITPIRPYIGIGFGRAVPHKRIGCQFDLGALFLGKQKIASKYYIEDPRITNFLDWSILPVISLRLVGKIF
ncbi:MULTISPECIES: hypothetical protein [unclassified Bacteroides]|jgi:hypothetical protein|uniref:hypothetical protein n=1 Tax=unclassified Bacteroides TaxID=2646097 RepID=UPI000E8EE22B|nr:MULTISPECIES: hypothetical protein [unclassified Bacteroides]RGN51291.1 hypothetical protein DXB63_00795 [Bacteroides sp. OM05-12]RHR78592.1 hypothetical protein DWW69_03945 [Bacteroides sp. AF16-49]